VPETGQGGEAIRGVRDWRKDGLTGDEWKGGDKDWTNLANADDVAMQQWSAKDIAERKNEQESDRNISRVFSIYIF
jgi:hypothetical protein